MSSKRPPGHRPANLLGGALAPHPPHLVYAENPPQNEPRAECGWEMLRWGYARLRQDIARLQPDVLVVHSPHWQTYIGTHFLGLERFKSRSVDPVFPNLFRYDYDLRVDVPLAEAICAEAAEAGLETQMMRNPDFRVDYGTLVSCHLVRPSWDLPIVVISSNRATHFYSPDVMQEQQLALGQATARAIARTQRRAFLLASESLSHRHFVREPDPPEDMTHEHITNHHQYLWDMAILDLLRRGKTRAVAARMAEFVDHSVAEADGGSLSWLLGALDFPTWPAEIYAYGTVIGTGNAVVGFFPPPEAK